MAIEANPAMRLIEIMNPDDPLALGFTHVLITETMMLKWLTVVLIGFTTALAVLTLRLALP